MGHEQPPPERRERRDEGMELEGERGSLSDRFHSLVTYWKPLKAHSPVLSQTSKLASRQKERERYCNCTCNQGG